MWGGKEAWGLVELLRRQRGTGSTRYESAVEGRVQLFCGSRGGPVRLGRGTQHLILLFCLLVYGGAEAGALAANYQFNAQ